MREKQTISIVIPAYNEMGSLPMLIRSIRVAIKRLSAYNFELVFVDNGSSDQTLGILMRKQRKDRRIKVVQLPHNVGVDLGIIAGLFYAKGNAAIVMNADLQDDPSLIPHFISRWEEGYDMVYAIVRKREGVSAIHHLFTKLLYKGLYALSCGFVPENVSDFRLIDRSVCANVLKRAHRYLFFRAAAAIVSTKSIGVPYDRPARAAGESKMSFADPFLEIRNALITLVMHGTILSKMFGFSPASRLFDVSGTYGI